MAVLANVRVATCGHDPADGGGTSTDGDAAVAKWCMVYSPGARSTYYVVYGYSQKLKRQMLVADNEEQAKQFCEDHGYEWRDENGFIWDLDYGEA